MKDHKGYELTNKGKELSKWVNKWLVQDDKEENSLNRKVLNSMQESKEEK